MSQENIEIVRQFYEAVERGFRAYWEDPRSAEDSWNAGEVGDEGVEMARYVHPNAEWKTLLTGITYAGIARGFDQLVDAAKDYRITLKEVKDLGGDNVLAVVKSAMKGRESGIDVTVLIFVVVTVRDGLITRMAEHLERSDALEAAGLRE